MTRIILIFLSLISLPLTYAGCGESPDKNQPTSLIPIGNINLYSFQSDDRYFLSKAQPYILPAETPLKGALTSLGKHLSETYFSYDEAGPGNGIIFEVVGIREIQTEPNPHRIAVINMIDREEYAMGHFFQGSTGGQTTFSMLGATFMQPHLDPPLLDGLILQYNGEMLQELDHINLSGILTPRLVKYVTKRAIRNTRMEFVGMARKRVDINKHDI